MNLPGATEKRAVTREQNTHGESNPAHFFVNVGWQNARWESFAIVKTVAKSALTPAPVLFRHRRAAKLMQKIHRLTHN
jgi:predicted amidohydrolase YtcJ